MILTAGGVRPPDKYPATVPWNVSGKKESGFRSVSGFVRNHRLMGLTLIAEIP